MNGSVYKREYMNSLFQYIENNLPSDLDSGLLSNAGHISYAQLYRDFYNITGHSVKEYIRKRRLSNALALIKTSDFGFPDIAYQCGYSSHQALCRAVRETLGMTPSEYKNGDTYYFFPPFKGESLQSVTVSSETIPKMICVLFYHSSLKDIERIAVNTFLKVFPEYRGRIFGRNGKQQDNRFCYKLYLTDIKINNKELRSFGFEPVSETPDFTCMFAASVVKNDDQKINAAWDYIYTEWLQNSMFEYTNEPYYEEYILKDGRPVKLKLYLPIKKRDEQTKITLIDSPQLHFIAAKATGYNAEERASQTVINYLTESYPYIVRTARELYLHKGSDYYICGVKISTDLQTGAIKNIENITADQGNYLVLESSVMGDYDRYAELLLSFAQNNGMTADRSGVFAVYDAKKSFDNLKIKMYCPVKIDTK